MLSPLGLSLAKIGILLTLLASSSLNASTSRLDQAQLKAVYLFKFTDYIQWPDKRAEESILLCFWEKNPFPQATAAASSAWRGKRAVVTRVVSSQDVTGACDMLYIPETTGSLDSKTRMLGKSGALLIGETERFLDEGGMIRFVTTEKGIGFDIDLTSVSAAQLSIRSTLLRIARNVRGQVR